MEAIKLYAKLEKDFIKPGLSDDWMNWMMGIEDFLSDNFKQRSMGVVCDNTNVVKKVYTAVFPTDKVMQAVLDSDEEEIMLFVHHPAIWDITKTPVFQPMNRKMLERFKQRKISIYNLHVPLDNYGEYSTSSNLAKAIGIKVEKPFAPYGGGLAGVIGKTKAKTLQELSKEFQKAIGHKTNLYPYGQGILNQQVSVVAGGGMDLEILQEVADEGINIHVTGISKLSDYSRKVHDFAKEHRISLIGGTHYSTERFACEAMCDYFRKLGLESRFIPGVPGMEDL